MAKLIEDGKKLRIKKDDRNKHAIESLNKYLDVIRKGTLPQDAPKELGVNKFTIVGWEKKIKFSEDEEERKLFQEYLDLYNEAIQGQKDVYFTAIGLKMLEYRSEGLHWVEIAAKFDISMATMNKWKNNPIVSEIMEIAEPKYNSYWLSKLKGSMDNARSNTGLVMYAMGKYIGIFEGMSLDDRFNITADDKQKEAYQRITTILEKQIIERVTLEHAGLKQIDKGKIEEG